MTAFIIGGACFWGWFFTARALYHRWKEDPGRDQAFLKCPRNHDGGYSHHGCCLDMARGMTDGGAAALAMLAAVVFPVVWATALVRWQPGKLRLVRSARGGLRAVRRTEVLAGKALEVAEREALRD